MLHLWRLEKTFLKDLVNAYPEPRPSVSTVSTLLRTLERKGFVTHKAYSKTFEYYPLIVRRNYLQAYFKDFLNKYFDGSYEALFSFLSEETQMEVRMPPPEGEEVIHEKVELSEAEKDAMRVQLSLF